MGFFNDIGTWVDENIVQPIGSWWDKNIAQPISEWNQKKIEERDNRTKELEKAMLSGNISEIETPRLTKDIGKILRENDKSGTMQEIKEKIEKKLGIEEQGNNQELGNNQEQEININGIQEEAPSIKELWEREDAIRKETQQREDTAYQRAVEDMRKAGINPNLTGINPASSGGGIINATGQGLITTEMSGIINEAIAKINNTVKADENQKDRITDIIRTLAMTMLLKK